MMTEPDLLPEKSVSSPSFLEKQPPFMQLMMLLTIVFACSMIMLKLSILLVKPLFGVLGVDVLLNTMGTDTTAVAADFAKINAIKFIQLMSSVGVFLLPALLFAYTKRPAGDYLKLQRPFSLILALLATLIILASGPLVDALYKMNQQMTFPASLKSVEAWMKDSEEKLQQITAIFLQMPSPIHLLINLIVIAFVPAIAEELLFRGVLQQLFAEWFRNIHIAIWTSAMLFSAIHFEFYGFVPRMMLGAILGYLFYWSANLWIPIIAHLINNGAQVLLSYLHQQGKINYDIESNNPIPIWMTIAALLILAAALFCFQRFSREKMILKNA